MGEAGLSSDAAQALLIQIMFIAYLEDRDIITDDYFRHVSQNRATTLSSLLALKNIRVLKSLFVNLRKDFNGDLFVAPCSFEPGSRAPNLEPPHLDLLGRFREGREEMGGGQTRFWGYDFRYIPIELVSAVYDRFLGEKEKERREQGAYYTPMFLADTVVSQVWDLLTPDVKERGRFLDPACGSGVFLVRSFQRLCEHWRSTRRARTIRWDSLLSILQRVHGWDVNGGAVRVAVFSLYVALLEEVSPPDIRRLIKHGKILPELWSKTLVCRDVFTVPEGKDQFDVIVGNPPWASRKGAKRSSVVWTKKHNRPMPGHEDAWAFVWKALRHLSHGGLVAFLLPAMGFLHNHAANTVAARNRLIRESRIRRIINFADLRFQLFEHAHRPAALVILGKGREGEYSYKFDYWTPKADLNLRIKRVITLSSVDKLSLSSIATIENPLAFKQRLWMREPDAKLFEYLSRFPKLGDFIADYRSMKHRKQGVSGQWIIGQGYQPYNGSEGSKYSISKYVGRYPDLPIGAFRRFVQPAGGLLPWHSSRVRRKGFEAGFSGTRILVPRGVETSQNRLRASYTEDDLTFQDIIQAITVPTADRSRGKTIAALLNSRVAIWYAFHGTASFGSDRPEVKQAELLRLPFPKPEDLPSPEQAQMAEAALGGLIDAALDSANGPFSLIRDDSGTLAEIDRLAYQYFCLSSDEIALIEDAVSWIMPAVQPHEGAFPDLWRAPSSGERSAYAAALAGSLAGWFKEGTTVNAHLEAYNSDLAVLRLSIDEKPLPYSEAQDRSISKVLARIGEHIHEPLDGNFQLMPDLRIFEGGSLFLIKPMQLRFWLRSTAFADADAIAGDMQDASELERRRSHA